MEILNRVSESVLKCTVENSNNFRSDSATIYKELSKKYSQALIYASLKELHEKQYIRFAVGDTSINGKIVLLPSGILYREAKRSYYFACIRQFLLSKISDIIVSVIVAFVTALIVA